MTMIESLIAHLFYCREIAHRAHLRTNSYAQHMALGAFYLDIVEKADAIAEAYMGRAGAILGDIPFVLDAPGEIVQALQTQRDWIDQNRGGYTSEIENLIDEAVQSIDSALYKLVQLS